LVEVESTGVDGVRLYRTGEPGPRVAVVGLVHGNEVVGGALLDRLEPMLPDLLECGELMVVRANLKAASLGVRHTPSGTDLNRLFDPDSLDAIQRLPEAERCYEHRRALELLPVLVTADLIFDLHSTSQPSPPHLLFRDDLAHVEIAEQLGIERLVVGTYENAILSGGLTADAGLRRGARSNRLGFTLEAGQHTDPINVERAFEAVMRLGAAVGLWPNMYDTPPRPCQMYEILDRFRQDGDPKKPWKFVGYVGGPAGGGRRSPPRMMAGFTEIDAGEMVLRRGKDVFRAQAPFTMLMPSPHAEPGDDLYYFAQRRQDRPEDRPRTDDLASAKASAVERVLDQLMDDAFTAGSTLVTLNPRRAHDTCAEMIRRVADLPDGHPHRRLTVIGRGDWGGDEREARSSKRYRQAMSLAVMSGVDVDRVQLMRGAPLAFLHQLTSGHVGKWLSTPGAGNLRLFLSTEQPHTLSILITGDPERALRLGEVDQVRVGLVIEAATVEPGSGEAHLRVARMGLFSARLEVVRAVVEMLDSLRQEHARLMQQDRELANDVAAWVGPQGAIHPSRSDDLDPLRRAMVRLQLRRWRHLMADELAPRTLGTAEDAGRFLSGLMGRHGALDERVLRALTLEQRQGEWSVADHLMKVGVEEVDGLSRPSGRVSVPTQVFTADMVDRDNYARFVGWKRFLWGAQSVPGVRGRDLDLAFDASSVQARVRDWYERVATRAAHKHVKVVIAGEGLRPSDAHTDGARATALAHRALAANPRVSLLRVQHGQGTHLGWLKDHLNVLAERPDHAAPVGLAWETQHGSMVNIVLIMESDEPPADPWDLDAMDVTHCAVVFADLDGWRGSNPQLGVFTESWAGVGINHELTQFARVHLEGLLRQSEWRHTGQGTSALSGQIASDVVEHVAAEIARSRRSHGTSQSAALQEANLRWSSLVPWPASSWGFGSLNL